VPSTSLHEIIGIMPRRENTSRGRKENVEPGEDFLTRGLAVSSNLLGKSSSCVDREKCSRPPRT